MNKILKTTMAMTVAAALFTGCSVEDAMTDTGSTSNGGSGGTSGQDTFSITKTSSGFDIDWSKGYQGYSEIVYREVGTSDPRGNGYPFTNNATGSYHMTCVKSREDTQRVSYECARSDLTLTSSVTLKKGVEYEWFASYGTDHEAGEPEVYMEYVSDTLTIE